MSRHEGRKKTVKDTMMSDRTARREDGDEREQLQLDSPVVGV